jgi:DnaK suppressor protein
MAENPSVETYRRMLYERREEIIRKSAYGMKVLMSGEIRQTVSAGQEAGDCSAVYQWEFVSYIQFYAQREDVAKIDLALRRLNEGNYGLCEECGEEIDVARLKVIPFALLCRDCQEMKERETIRRGRSVF